MKSLTFYSLALISILLFHSCDKNEYAPVILDQTFSLQENCEAGTVVGTVQAYDNDEGQIVSFEIVNGNLNGTFAIDPSSGIISVTDPAEIDFEVNTEFLLTISVSDNHGKDPLVASALVHITILNVREINEGMLAHYPFDGNADDASDNGLHGISSGVNPTTNYENQANSAFSFDGIDDYVILGDDFDLPEKSISFRFRANSIPTYEDDPLNLNSWSTILVANHPGMQYGGFHVFVSNIKGVDKLCIWKVGMVEVFDPEALAVPIERSTWYDVSLLISNNSVKLYVDGLFAAEYQTFIRSSSQFGEPKLIVGSGRNLDLRFFNGSIDDIIINNRILEVQEIELYANSN